MPGENGHLATFLNITQPPLLKRIYSKETFVRSEYWSKVCTSHFQLQREIEKKKAVNGLTAVTRQLVCPATLLRACQLMLDRGGEASRGSCARPREAGRTVPPRTRARWRSASPLIPPKEVPQKRGLQARICKGHRYNAASRMTAARHSNPHSASRLRRQLCNLCCLKRDRRPVAVDGREAVQGRGDEVM